MLDPNISESIIIPAELSKFKIKLADGSEADLSPAQLSLLKKAIIKIKCHQLAKLALDLTGILQGFEDYDQEIRQKLFNLVTLSTVKTSEEFVAIFSVATEEENKEKAEDKVLKAQITALNLQDPEQEYSSIYRFRHQYFLNRPFMVRNRKEAFPETKSENYLARGHKSISYYLQLRKNPDKEKVLTQEEITLLEQCYANLRVKKNRNRAHAHISLTILEIQQFICSALERMKEIGKVPESYGFCKLSDDQQRVYNCYTNEPSFNLIASNNLEEFQKQQVDPKIINYHTRVNALSFAVQRQNLVFVKYLLTNGADVKQKDNDFYTALHHAIYGIGTFKKEIFTLILNAPDCDANAKIRGSYTALYLICEDGDLDLVKLLLEGSVKSQDVDVNEHSNRYSSTALMIAVRNGRFGIVDYLLQNEKVDRTVINREGETAEKLAKKKDTKLAELFVKPPVPRMVSGVTAVTMQPHPIPQHAMPQGLMPQQPLAQQPMPQGLMPQQLLPQQPMPQPFLQQIAFQQPGNQNRNNSPQQGTSTVAVPNITPPQNQLGQRFPPPPQRPANRQVNLQELVEYIESPKENENKLRSIRQTNPNIINPYIHFNSISELTNESFDVIEDLFAKTLAVRKKAENNNISKFQPYLNNLKHIVNDKLTFPQAYFKITELIKRFKEDKIFDIRAILIEIWRQGFLLHLIHIQDKKQPMQVAIDGEDCDCIHDILLEKPDQSIGSIFSKNKKITAFEYAMEQGKENSVKKLLEETEKNPKVNLGTLPQNPMEILKQKKEELLLKENSAFKEANDSFNINVPYIFDMNSKKLLRRLIATAPTLRAMEG